MSENKPLAIQIKEAKANIIESINGAIRGGLPCYLLELIIAEAHSQVSKQAQVEYAQAQIKFDEEKKMQLAKEEALKKLAEQEKKGDDPDERM